MNENMATAKPNNKVARSGTTEKLISPSSENFTILDQV
jgi:hypothetical protein